MRFLKFQGLFTVLMILVVGACNRSARVLKSPPGYNFSKPVVSKLDLKIREISGIAWDSKNDVILAVNDEKGTLFALDKETKIINAEYKFGDAGDYEDVAIYNGVPYVLRSDGQIIKIIRDDSDGTVRGLDADKVNLSGTNDFETMYTDTARKALIVLCKNCVSDSKKTVSAFAYYPERGGFDSKPVYTLDADIIDQLAAQKSSKFQPSAAAIHPIQKKLYILSSASNQLAVADLNGHVEAVYRLTPKLFTQPEGITFNKSGDMYISNESTTKATLVKFDYTHPSDTAQKSMGKAAYDFTKPSDKMELGDHLHEISGMAFIPEEKIILAENDEKGNIFKVDFANKKSDPADKLKFGGKGDYEDIVHLGSDEYMLISTGSVLKVETNDGEAETEQFDLGISGNNEFETMYLDADGKTIILLCKECAHEKKEQLRHAYRFNPETKTFDGEAAYVIDINAVRAKLNDESPDFEFKPSAAGINPVDGKLYIVASVGKLLVVASATGQVEQVYRLDPAMYNQPEGLTFAPNGDLYISNEGGEGIATILKFELKK